MALNQDEVNFVYCPIQGNKIEGGVLNRLGILRFFCCCSKQRQGFKPSAAHQYPNIGRVNPGGYLTLHNER